MLAPSFGVFTASGLRVLLPESVSTHVKTWIWENAQTQKTSQLERKKASKSRQCAHTHTRFAMSTYLKAQWLKGPLTNYVSMKASWTRKNGTQKNLHRGKMTNGKIVSKKEPGKNKLKKMPAGSWIKRLIYPSLSQWLTAANLKSVDFFGDRENRKKREKWGVSPRRGGLW